MLIPQAKQDEYVALLKRADWYYMYADGAAYHNGMDSFFAASSYRKSLLFTYPDAKDLINNLWLEYGGKL